MTVLHVAVVRPDDRARLVLGFERELINKGTISKRSFDQVRTDRSPTAGAGNCFPYSLRADDEVRASARWAIVHRIPGDAFVDFVRKNERLDIGRGDVVSPWTGVESPYGIGRSAIIGRRSMVAEIELAPVVTLPEPITDRVDSREKSVATDTHLPLHWAGWAAGECYSTRTVVLRAAVCHWRSRTSEVGADIAGVELDGV